MKKAFFTLAAMLTGALAMSQFYVYKDGEVILSMESGVADSITFSKPQLQVYKTGTEDGHGYVDLGLTSGTKWATCNVGADNPSAYGAYYAWGEVAEKTSYAWSNYFDTDDNGVNFNEYGAEKKSLDPEDDAAHVKWGGKWVMPADKDFEELLAECYWQWTDKYSISNAKGYIVYKVKYEADKGLCNTSENTYTYSDAHIFLPAAGEIGESANDVGTTGRYWSSSLRNATTGKRLGFDSSKANFTWGDRYYGRTVRAVIKK
jgi:hypothetical protein